MIFDCDYNLVAPLFKNSSVGKVSVMINNELLSSCDIILNNDIYKNGINDYLALFFKNYLVNINDLLWFYLYNDLQFCIIYNNLQP